MSEGANDAYSDECRVSIILLTIFLGQCDPDLCNVTLIIVFIIIS